MELASIPLDATSRLALRVHNSAAGVTVALRGLIRGPDNAVKPFQHTLTPSTDRALSNNAFLTGPGELLCCTLANSAGAPLRGQTFCQVHIACGPDDGSNIIAPLLSDYLQNNVILGWPGAPLRSSLDGPGVIRSITGTDPAAGVEISETVPTNARWRVHGFRAIFVSDATVTTRFTSLLIDDGATDVFGHSPNGGVTASTTNRITWAGASIDMTGLRAQTLYPLPILTPLRAGFRLRTSTFALQAGDNWGAPQMWIEEWIEP